jgi:preprotein translocase SecE subunit
MAEEAPSPKKRLVKNPETFRERAVKAAEQTNKPTWGNRVRSGIGKIFMPILRPIGRFFKKLFSIQPFKFFARVARWIGLIIFPKYVRNSFRELKGVTWPTLKQSRQLTFAVLAFAIIFGGAIALVDLGLDDVFKRILLK